MMDDDLTSDLNLKIPLKSIYEEFFCPVCFNIIQDCYMTICGHNFCKGCIEECLNRKKQCPCCNHSATPQELRKNLQHDRLVGIVDGEKEVASKKYFEKLIANGQKVDKSINNNSNNNNNDNSLSPIELLFHKHMKKSLTGYEEYYKSLLKKFESTQQQLKDKCKSKIEEMTKEFTNKEQLTIEIQKVTNDWEIKNKEIEQSFEQSKQLLLNSYDLYLTSIAPAVEYLPTTINILLLSKNIQYKKHLIKTTDTLFDLKNFIENKMKESNNPIVDWKNIEFAIRRSLLDDESQDEIIQDEYRPLLQYKIDPNTNIIIKGKLQLKSDLPKQCFSTTYEKGKDLTMDYYTCKDCKINWICKPCLETCHQGHSTVDYLKAHKPTWGCCYCKKNRKCKLVQ